VEFVGVTFVVVDVVLVVVIVAELDGVVVVVATGLIS